MAELLPCPFCGCEARVSEVLVFANDARCVSCTGCGMRTQRVLIHHPNVLGEDDFTVEEAEAKAIKLWNTRTP